MRIDPKLVPPVTVREPRARRASAKPFQDSSDASTVVSLSAGATAAAASSSIDAEVAQRIETLKLAIEKGDYQVDLDVLADKIVDDELVRGG
jgi:flagellar biosynthesis anti-sigma factor FlgM